MKASKQTLSPLSRSLSARLLVLTIAFVMLGEVLIYAPSIARFRKTYLEERIAAAHLATVALEASPSREISDGLQSRLLAYSDAHNIVLRLPERSVFALGPAHTPMVDATFDLREPVFFGWIGDAFSTLVQTENRVLRIIGPSPKDPNVVVEVILDERPMRAAMIGYSNRILGLSIVISVIAAGLVFLSLQWLMVRPMRRITESMIRFRAAPENEHSAIEASARSDEIGLAQRELARMQDDLRLALRQKTRLAALGSAVAKINHDLRNSLTTAVLVSERLAGIDDPTVKRVLPRLVGALDRAVRLCADTLGFAGDAKPRLDYSRFALRDLVSEVAAGVAEAEPGINGVKWTNDVAAELTVNADREQLYRALANVGRNAVEAGAKAVRLSADANHDRVFIDVADDGPGLSERALANMFEPFAGSARDGGTGLGLVIVRDVMRAHGGDVNLLSTGAEGTTFRLELPK